MTRKKKSHRRRVGPKPVTVTAHSAATPSSAPVAAASSEPKASSAKPPLVRIEIKHRWTNALLYAGDHASMLEAVLAATKARADLSGANLSGAYLSRADLSGAYLSRADLSGANLSRAYLSGAEGPAKGLDARRVVSLLMLLDQPARMRLYKLVDANLLSPMSAGHAPPIKYEIGSTVEVKNADTDPLVECGAGVNVADLPWVIRNWHAGRRIMVVEFEAKDIAAIPTATDGKIRLHRCAVVGEKDLVELGLVDAPKPDAAAVATTDAAAVSK